MASTQTLPGPHPAISEHGDVTIALPLATLTRLIGSEAIAQGLAQHEGWAEHFRGQPRPEDVRLWFEGYYGAAAARVINALAAHAPAAERS